MDGQEPAFDISTTLDGTTAVITVVGEIDLATAPQLSSAFAEADRNGATAVRVRLGAVSFLDSSGISVLVQAHKDLEARNGRLVLDEIPEPARRVLDVAGLGEFFHRAG